MDDVETVLRDEVTKWGGGDNVSAGAAERTESDESLEDIEYHNELSYGLEGVLLS